MAPDCVNVITTFDSDDKKFAGLFSISSCDVLYLYNIVWSLLPGWNLTRELKTPVINFTKRSSYAVKLMTFVCFPVTYIDVR